MKKVIKEISDLSIGDIVKNIGSGNIYVIVDVEGNAFATAIKTKIIYNVKGWVNALNDQPYKDLSSFEPGNIILNRESEVLNPYIVTGNYGNFVTTVFEQNIMNPVEWVVL